jgi:hypothetical protein
MQHRTNVAQQGGYCTSAKSIKILKPLYKAGSTGSLSNANTPNAHS